MRESERERRGGREWGKTGDDVDDDDNDKEISINVLEFHFGTVYIISIMHLRVC